MTTDPAGDELDELRATVDRLQRRADRERAARLEAEHIAEEGLRNLYEANRRLEDRVRERTEELERSLAAATMGAAAKERFLAELGHDLHTPMHNVLGLLELIEPSRLDDDDRQRLDEIRRHAHEVSELLRGLIELAAADGPSAPDDVTTRAPGRWLDEVVEAWTRPAARRGQLLVPSAPSGAAELRLDWTRLRRVADEVLDNVVTHADAGPVGLDVTADASRLTIKVSDAGPGFDEATRTSVTEPFVAGPGSDGMGIGLAIAARSAAALGGTLTIDGGDGRTVVTVSVPTATTT